MIGIIVQEYSDVQKIKFNLKGIRLLSTNRVSPIKGCQFKMVFIEESCGSNKNWVHFYQNILSLCCHINDAKIAWKNKDQLNEIIDIIKASQ